MRKRAKKQIIGILGGMGPQASARLLDLLIDLSIKEFGAKNGDEFPEILLDSVPVPDFISNSDNKSVALDMLKKRVKKINQLPISRIGIACNTAHILFDDLQKISKAPFVSMISEVVDSVNKAQLKRVGVVGTPSTIKSKLYQKALDKFNIKGIEPTESELRILDKIIRKVIEEKTTNKDQRRLRSMANSLKKKGAEGIILGCTELPLVFPPKFSLPVFNSLEILARALLRNYYK